MELDLFWNDLMLKIAKSGTMSYSEIKTLKDINEFFLILTNLELQNKQQSE